MMDQRTQPASAPRRRSRRLFAWLSLHAGPVLISGALWALSLTLRIRVLDLAHLGERWARGEQVIVAFWHDRLILMPVMAGGRKACVLLSRHRDGEIAMRAAARWGVHSVRGSVTRGAVGGFLNLLRAFRQGYTVAVVPDGPRGPRHVAKPGVIHLARAAGAPIVPVSYAASRAIRLRSWDRFLIPLPFARVVLITGEPVSVRADAGREELERSREILESRLDELGQAADAALAA